jgi:hypothetical protein
MLKKTTKNRWGVFDEPEAVHVAPIDDWVDHSLDEDCICRPEIEYGQGQRPLVIHDAADGRQ